MLSWSSKRVSARRMNYCPVVLQAGLLAQACNDLPFSSEGSVLLLRSSSRLRSCGSLREPFSELGEVTSVLLEGTGKETFDDMFHAVPLTFGASRSASFTTAAAAAGRLR